MVKQLLCLLLFWCLLYHPAHAGPINPPGVTVHGAITPGDCAQWFNGNAIQDSGSGCGTGGSMVYPGAGIAVSTGTAWGTSITPGTGVAAALAINTGSIGAFLVNGGALGTPSGGTLTNVSGLPLTGIVNIAANTTLGAITLGAPTALSMPSCSGASSALIWTTGTGWGCNTITAGAATIAVGSTTITGGTTTRVLFDNAGVAGEYAVSGTVSVCMTTNCVMTTPNLGTPSAVTLSNGTGLPIAGTTGWGTGVATALANTLNASSGLVGFSGNIGAATGTSLTTSGIGSFGTVAIGTTSVQTGVVLDMTTLHTAMTLPTGTVAQRPTGIAGMCRYNSSTPGVECFYSSAWNALGTGGGGGVSLSANNTWTAGQAVTPDTATSCGTQSAAGTMTPNFAVSNSCNATFGAGNFTVANPTGIIAGQVYVIDLTQDAVGGRVITAWGTDFKWGGGTAPTLSTGASDLDEIVCRAHDSSTLVCAEVIVNAH